jgi:hypothetical protein
MALKDRLILITGVQIVFAVVMNLQDVFLMFRTVGEAQDLRSVAMLEITEYAVARVLLR